MKCIKDPNREVKVKDCEQCLENGKLLEWCRDHIVMPCGQPDDQDPFLVHELGKYGEKIR